MFKEFYVEYYDDFLKMEAFTLVMARSEEEAKAIFNSYGEGRCLYVEEYEVGTAMSALEGM